MIPVTADDLQRTRDLLAERAARQERLGRELDATGIRSFVDRADWLIAQRTPDEQLAWDRLWPEGIEQVPMPVLTGAEVIEELDWLLHNGSTPWEASEQLGRKVGSLRTLAYEHGRRDLAVLMSERIAS